MDKVLSKPNNIDMKFLGTLKETLEFVEQNQLFDVSLWKKFVEIFRVKDDGRGDFFVSWRSEYWGKMMRGGSMVTRYPGNEEIYEILKECYSERKTRKESDTLSQILTYIDRRTGETKYMIMKDLVFINFRTYWYYISYFSFLFNFVTDKATITSSCVS